MIRQVQTFLWFFITRGMVLWGCLLTAVTLAAETVHDTDQLIALQVQTVDGKNWNSQDLRGQWLIINYWATWCTPCLEEMSALDAFAKQHKNVRVLGLAFDNITLDELKKFLQQHPVSYDIAQIDIYHPLTAFPEPKGLPVTYVINPQGVQVAQFIGPVTDKDLKQLIDVQK